MVTGFVEDIVLTSVHLYTLISLCNGLRLHGSINVSTHLQSACATHVRPIAMYYCKMADVHVYGFMRQVI